MTEPRKFFELISDDTYDVTDVHIINHDWLYVTNKKSKEFQTPALNTNIIISFYAPLTPDWSCTANWCGWKIGALYCDTDSIIYRHVDGMYNPLLSEFVGGMTNELGETYITEYDSNGPKKTTHIVQATVNRWSRSKVSH